MTVVTQTSETSEPTVLLSTKGRAAHIRLNRPRALNALDTDMIRQIQRALDGWEHDDAVQVVILDGAGERGLCAGGDVRSLYDFITAGKASDVTVFFREEYALNARLGEYAKPVVALADGITMGGGIGLAGHAAVRVVTERSKLAMPETRIGLTPDVGGSWLLAHAPGRLGEYLAVTGTVMDAADAVHVGLADHVVPSDRLDALRDALASDPADPADVVRRFAVDAAPSAVAARREWVDAAFDADTVGDVVVRLRERAEEEASAAARAMGELSPTSMAVTLQAVRRARGLADLRAGLAQEYGLVMWFVHTQPDLVEGIRAQLVDKDRNPRWNPAGVAAVTPDVVDAAFARVPAVPLWE